MAVLGSGTRGALSNTTITTSATLLTADDSNRLMFFFQNNDASAAVYLGGSGVDDAVGSHEVKVAAGGSYSDTKSRQAWYACTASGSVTATAGYTVT
jgi:hypothetical protein